MTEDRSSGAFTLLLYSQDSKGMGHVTRTLTIARHILAAYPNSVAYITTESPAVGDFALPDRCDYIKLPKRLSSGAEHVTKDDETRAKARFRNVRAQILRDVALGLAPDLVLVDHEPLGYKGELREGLYALKARSPGTKFVLGLRDIMDDADRIRTKWREMGVYDALEHLYDGIAVYGSQNLYDVAEAYAIPPSTRAKLHYCGYIVREPPRVDGTALRRQHGLRPDERLVVATVGSGVDGYAVLATVQDAVRRLRRTHPKLRAILVTGPFMPAEEKARLQSRATATCRVLSRADNFQLIAAADAVVSMGGYNSVCEALVVGRPLVIVPRATHKVEQLIRAETMAAHGLARCVHPRDLSGERLAEALDWALLRDPAAHERIVREAVPAFDGTARLTAYLAYWLSQGPMRVPPVRVELTPVVQPA